MTPRERAERWLLSAQDVDHFDMVVHSLAAEFEAEREAGRAEGRTFGVLEGRLIEREIAAKFVREYANDRADWWLEDEIRLGTYGRSGGDIKKGGGA